MNNLLLYVYKMITHPQNTLRLTLPFPQKHEFRWKEAKYRTLTSGQSSTQVFMGLVVRWSPSPQSCLSYQKCVEGVTSLMCDQNLNRQNLYTGLTDVTCLRRCGSSFCLILDLNCLNKSRDQSRTSCPCLIKQY